MRVEILSKQGYGKGVDIWSIGYVGFFLSFRTSTTISTMSDDLEKSIKPEKLLTAFNYCSWAQNTAAKLRS